MALIDWLNRTRNITGITVVVEELLGTEPDRQYQVHVSGTSVATGEPVNFFYATTKEENINDYNNSVAKVIRYEDLAVTSTVERDVEEEVMDEIEDLEPTPEPPPEP